jgi:hypothetical protein
MKNPNTKTQIPNNRQTAISVRNLIWNLGFLWGLVVDPKYAEI